MINPTDNCNYLLDERLMFGSYPTPAKPLNTLNSNGIDHILTTHREVFVNLVTPTENQRLYDYPETVRKVIVNPLFIYYPIDDDDIPHDLIRFRKFIETLYFLYLQDYKIYIHCLGGHGRSGLVSACLLIHIGYSANKALQLVADAHKTRHHLSDYPCPATREQVNFVYTYKI